ncbi:hypothetical protein BOQ04_06635 [Polynucleobacter sphagniphilus]|nr:hypothetical protein BOQ04_06635 [Polynucleobacter sphagniphilus]
MDSIKSQQTKVNFQNPSLKGIWSTISIFSSKFKKPLPFGASAFFPGFISVQHLASSRAPMNGSLVGSNLLQSKAEMNGRVFLIGSLY